MYRQISLFYSGDKSLFDVKRLIFSLLIVCMRNRFSNSLIRKKVLQIIFDNQDSKTGLWDIGHVVAPEFIIGNGEIKYKGLLEDYAFLIKSKNTIYDISIFNHVLYFCGFMV